MEITIIQTIIFWAGKRDVFIQHVSPKKHFVSENFEISPYGQIEIVRIQK